MSYTWFDRIVHAALNVLDCFSLHHHQPTSMPFSSATITTNQLPCLSRLLPSPPTNFHAFLVSHLHLVSISALLHSVFFKPIRYYYNTSSLLFPSSSSSPAFGTRSSSSLRCRTGQRRTCSWSIWRRRCTHGSPAPKVKRWGGGADRKRNRK